MPKDNPQTLRRARGHRPHRGRQRFHEFKALYGTTLVTGFAHILG
jgi:acetyl-CoA carboxylase carboxyltransferase component